MVLHRTQVYSFSTKVPPNTMLVVKGEDGSVLLWNVVHPLDSTIAEVKALGNVKVGIRLEGEERR